VRKEYEFKNDVLILSNTRLLRPHTLHPEKYRDYFIRQAYEKDMVLIPCVTIDSRLYKLYAFIQHVDDRFGEKMCDYIQIRVQQPIQMPAKTALREFLALYNIYESEYGSDTAYKRWQRSTQYKNLKNERSKQTI